MNKVLALLRTPSVRTRWTAAVIATGLVAYGWFGFFVAPGLLRTKLIETGSAATGAPLTLGRVSVNPFMLSVTLRDCLLPDRNGERIVAFDTLYLNFQLSSLVRRAYTFADLRVTNPYLHTLVREDGSVNLQDVLPATATAPPSAAPASRPGPPRPPTPVLVFHLVIAGGVIAYEDRQRTTPFVARVEPLNLSLHHFTTRPLEEGVYQFEAATDKGERLAWRGDIGVVPPHSSGHLALSGFQARTFWSYLQDQVNYEVTGGTAAFEADYQFNFAANPRVFTVRDGNGRLDSLTLLDRRDGSVAASVPTVSMKGLEARLLDRVMHIAEIRTSGGTLSGIVGKDSAFSLSTLFLTKIDPKAPLDTGPAWKLRLDHLAIDDYAVAIEDQTTRPVGRIAFLPLTLSLENYRYELPGEGKVDLRFAVDSQGSVAIAGTFASLPHPAAALDIGLTAVPLKPFQPWVNGVGRINVKSGTLSLAGQATYRTKGTHGAAGFKGNLWVENLRAKDPALREDFTRWTRLDVKGIAYRSEPPSLSIAEIVARGLYLRAIVGPDRITNMQNIFAPVDSIAPWSGVGPLDSLKNDSGSIFPVATKPPPATPAPAAGHDTVAAAMATRIGLIRVLDGTLNFSDFSLTPNFTVSIEQLGGAIKGLSSAQPNSGDVALEGKVDRYAPATIQGQVNPLSAQAYTDLALNFEGIDLTTFTPYSGKFAGYKIDKGKLTLALHYKLHQRQLIGENRIILDQLTLGEKVQSPDATSLPVKLAVALLKDSHGVIDLNIPVSGNIDDPHFKVMPIVLKALVRLFVKVVTSPFRLLGALFGGGGGDDLAYVAFPPGADTLAGVQRDKVDSLARALIERPGLNLGIRGAAAISVDREALARRAVAMQIRGRRTTTFGPPTAAEADRVLTLYRGQFNEDPALLVPATDSAGNKLTKAAREAAITQAAFQKLVDQYQVPDSALQSLALRRANRVKDHLVLTDSVPEPRLFLQGVDTDASARDGEVRVQLALDAP